MRGRSLYVMALGVLGAWAVTVACESSPSSSDCGTVSTATGSPGAIHITGDFSGGDVQPLLTVSPVGGGASVVHPATTYDASSATFTGIPAGSYNVIFELSGCTDGGGNDPGMLTDARSNPGAPVTVPAAQGARGS